MTVSRLLLLLAVIVFALAAFSVSAGVPLIPVGLALFAASFIA